MAEMALNTKRQAHERPTFSATNTREIVKTMATCMQAMYQHQTFA